MIRIRRLSLCALLLVTAAVARADHPTVKGCGHWYYDNTDTPMVETGPPGTVIVPHSTNWTTLVQSCANELNATSETMVYNAVWRYWLAFESNNIPPGTGYQVEIATIKGTNAPFIEQVVNRKVQHYSYPQQPHSDFLAGFIPNLTGDHGYRIRMRFLTNGSGSAAVNVGLGTFQGSKMEYGGARNTGVTSMTLDTTWREIGYVTINNYSGGEVDVQLQGHFTITSGTPGTGISIGIAREMNSSGNHYSRAFIPAHLPEEITVLDYIPNEGAGTSLVATGNTTFRMWAKLDAGTATISNRRLEALGMDAAPANETIRYYQFANGPKTLKEALDPGDVDEGQPLQCWMRTDDLRTSPTGVCTSPDMPPCGRWTKLFEGEIPPLGAVGYGLAAIGAGHLEITGKSCKGGGMDCWSSGATIANVAIEMLTPPNSPTAATEFLLASFSVESAPMKVHFFTDAFHWGNVSGQKVRLWVRLVDYPCNGVGYSEQQRQLTIGRSYLGVRFFHPTGTLVTP